MSGKSFNIKRLGFMLVALAGIAIAAIFFLNKNGPNIVAGTKSIQLPDRFNNLHTRDEALKRLGEPARKSLNPKWENKSPEQWQKLEKEAGELEASNSDPYGAAGTNDSYTKLIVVEKSLSHRYKEAWFYSDNKRGEDGYVVYFEADGTVINITRLTKPRSSNNPVPH